MEGGFNVDSTVSASDQFVDSHQWDDVEDEGDWEDPADFDDDGDEALEDWTEQFGVNAPTRSRTTRSGILRGADGSSVGERDQAAVMARAGNGRPRCRTEGSTTLVVRNRRSGRVLSDFAASTVLLLSTVRALRFPDTEPGQGWL
jgi:hypothetical protein